MEKRRLEKKLTIKRHKTTCVSFNLGDRALMSEGWGVFYMPVPKDTLCYNPSRIN